MGHDPYLRIDDLEDEVEFMREELIRLKGRLRTCLDPRPACRACTKNPARYGPNGEYGILCGLCALHVPSFERVRTP